jgi:valyl-tRNA synthetase
VLSRLDRLVEEVDRHLREFQPNEAGHRIYDFLWGDYCDWYLEMAKVRLREPGTGNREQGTAEAGPLPSTHHPAPSVDPRPVLVHVLETGLRLLHPFMPFVTEELWQRLRPYLVQPPAGALIVAPWPKPEPAWRDQQAEREVDGVIEIVRAIRNIRSEKRVEPARYVEAYVVAGADARAAIEAGAAQIEALARVRPLRIVSDASEAPRDGVATAVLPHAQVIVPLAGLLDAGAERARLAKEIEETEAYLVRVEAKLSNEQFRSRAPREIVAAEEERRANAQTRLEGLRRALAELE